MVVPVGLDRLDHLEAERFSPLGDTPLLLIDASVPPPHCVQAVVVGLDPAGQLPALDPAGFDVLLTTAIDPPAPWVGVASRHWDAHLNRLREAVTAAPDAAAILCQTLRLTAQLSFAAALQVESLAYSTLLGGAAFARWRDRRGVLPPTITADPPLIVARAGDDVTITLASPDSRNAMTAAMRDALFEALAAVLDDPTQPTLVLRGAGRAFSTGGALDEFGSARDPARAHLIRDLRSPARLLDELGPRARVQVHGAVIGSGLEIAAAAQDRIAAADSFFQLPELRLGLMPGAGGTVSVARAIGRHRTAWMVLSGARLGVRTAQRWGLVQQVLP